MKVDGRAGSADRWWHDWHDEGRERFGFHFDYWWFVCPECSLAFQPVHAREVGVFEDYHGCLCPKGIGGCGFPQTMGTKLTRTARFKFLDPQERVRMSQMVSLAKDGPRPVMRVFPFCPDDFVPDDGKPTYIDTEA